MIKLKAAVKMLKSSKLSHKPHKSSKDSVMRKDHISKKILRGRSPVRSSGSSRPPSMKPISPGMKRSHPVPKRKASHSPRLRSIASSPHRSLSHRNKPESPESMDRVHAMKAFKYEKRKRVSNSPMRHMAPASPHRPVIQRQQHSVSPYAERFQASGSVHPVHYSPSRKKSHREAERFCPSRSASASPPRRHMVKPLHPESHMPPRPNVSPSQNRHQRNMPLSHGGERGKHNYDIPIKHHPSPMIPSGRAKDGVVKAPFPNANNRYRSSSPDNRYLPVTTKSYGPTLHERFSSVIDRSELSVRYSREDLEKITIDVRNPSPPARHLVNPAKIKLVSRAHEGRRPIFDRDELKYASKDVREDAYYDRKTSSYAAAHSVNLQGSENYQIARPRYGSHHENYSSGSRHPVNERYPAHEPKKSVSLDRDEREREYARAPGSRAYVHSRSRSRSGDRDFRSDRYLDAKPSSSRPEYQGRAPVPAPESRNNVPYPHRKGSLHVDARHKLNIRKGERESHLPSLRSETKEQYFSSGRHYPEPIPSSRERREHHLPEPEQPKWDYRSRSPSREKLIDLSRRPDKYGYKPWNDKPDVSVKSSSYHEYGSREGSSSFRGSSRPFRSTRGFRSRGFRGPMRGSSFHRGSFRGSYRSSSSPRARGPSRR